MEVFTMKKFIYSTLCTAGLFSLAACSGYLETGSPSVVDADFVFSNSETSRAAMSGVYERWRSTSNSLVFGAGLYYASDVAGSDIERHPEKYSAQPARHIPECFYVNGTEAGTYGLLSYQKEGTDGTYGALYDMIGKSNAIINAIQSTDGFEAMMAGTSATETSQLYGEAIAARATAYRELIKYFGDVPYPVKNGEAAQGLSPRDSIYEVCIEDLKAVEPLMYRVGENGVAKNYFSRTYVQGLIARLCMEAGGYQTRRSDWVKSGFYKNIKGETLSFETSVSETNGSTYGRRTDWKEFYNTAKTYLAALIANPGSAKFNTTDPRSTGSKGQVFDNPYQYFFQQMNDLQYADESIYEVAMTQGVSNERPYSSGRPSSGGSKQAFPCKSYGQARINPAYYYGVYDPQDKRRDVSICVTGTNGAGVEVILPFTPGSTTKGGGLSLNKWDENRMANPYVKAQRNSGINGPYMRMSEIYLAYAEVCAQTGDEATAKSYLKKIRERAFASGQDKTDAFIASEPSLLEAILDERGFEFAGEGDRRWTLIRNGLIGKKVDEIKALTAKMFNGLKSQGYYTFDNGNTISLYIWTKTVDAGTEKGYRLTTQCPTGKEDDPVLYPGWRGVNDDWDAYKADAGKACYSTDKPKTNLAIKGLFKYIDPNGSEAAALEADGYTKTGWGQLLLNNEDEYSTYVFYKYDSSATPIYLWPFTPNVLSAGGFTNGYGFKQE
jgi:hypothetical protein